MPYGTMKTFIDNNIAYAAMQKKAVQNKQIRWWYETWRKSNGITEVAAVAEKQFLKSRAPVALAARKRAHGGGRKTKAVCVRQSLYEWYAAIRYAIDWKQMIAENRSRGKKHLARFPRAIIGLKAMHVLQEHA